MVIKLKFKGLSLRINLNKNDTNHLSKSRLVFYKRSAVGENQYNVFILNFVPSNSFSQDIDGINVSNYHKKKFDGKVFVSGLDNRITGVYDIKNGNRSNFMKVTANNRSDVQLRDIVCYDVCWNECGYYYKSENGVFTLVYECHEMCDYNICTDDGNCSSCDPCNSANPPSWCNTGDPCDQPLPPPTCNDGGDDTGDDDTGCLIGDCDNDGDDDEDQICASNLTFSSANESTSIRQEAAIEGLYAKLSSSLTINLGALYFSTPFHDVNGNMVMSHDEAAKLAAEAINFGENIMRNEYHNANTIFDTPEKLRNLWQSSTEDYFKSVGEPGQYSYHSGYQIAQNQINMGHTPIKRGYTPCD